MSTGECSRADVNAARELLCLECVGEIGQRHHRLSPANHTQHVGGLVDKCVLVPEAMARRPPGIGVGCPSPPLVTSIVVQPWVEDRRSRRSTRLVHSLKSNRRAPRSP